MSTLQHTSELREHATRRLILIILVATIAAGAIAVGIVAITGGGSSAKVDASPVVHAQPMYMSGALQRDLTQVKAAHAARARSQTPEPPVPTAQTPGQRP